MTDTVIAATAHIEPQHRSLDEDEALARVSTVVGASFIFGKDG
jgi:hypothetical protein